MVNAEKVPHRLPTGRSFPAIPCKLSNTVVNVTIPDWYPLARGHRRGAALQAVLEPP